VTVFLVARILCQNQVHSLFHQTLQKKCK